ncbi:MAG: biopolymer transporter ExbD [Hahellaceae bacterium]|nr:biopolymer transporter ExbD [Hahellaceae bacterium]
MRRLRVHDTTEEESINLTPMLDVMFILLIFFIVSSSFVKEAGVEVERPEATSAETQTQSPLMLAISAEEIIWLEQQTLDVRRVRTELERRKQQQPDLRVLVQADAQSSTGALVGLLDQIRLAGLPYAVATTGINP